MSTLSTNRSSPIYVYNIRLYSMILVVVTRGNYKLHIIMFYILGDRNKSFSKIFHVVTSVEILSV